MVETKFFISEYMKDIQEETERKPAEDKRVVLNITDDYRDDAITSVHSVKLDIEPRMMGVQEIIDFLSNMPDEEFEKFRANIEEGLFPSMSIVNDTLPIEFVITGWGLNDTKAETILIYRHDKKHGRATKFIEPLYDPSKAINDAMEKIQASGSTNKIHIEKIIDKLADSPTLASIIKMYAEAVDYDLALCQPILDGSPLFYTRMSEVNLYELGINKGKISVLRDIKNELIGLGTKIDFLTVQIIRSNSENNKS